MWRKLHWCDVLDGLLYIVQFLVWNNLAFQGVNEKIFELSNRNFLGFVELESKFDPILHEHLCRITSSEVSDHYLDKDI